MKSPEGKAQQLRGPLDLLVDEDGSPPCDPLDRCPVCLLFTHRREGESGEEWLARLLGAGARPRAN